MQELFGAGRDVGYQERTETLFRNRVATWDVVRSAQRTGSSDSRIVRGSEEPTDFDKFLRAHRGIGVVFFNEQRAEDLYRALVVPSQSLPDGPPRMHRLPSTSPANTHMTREEKPKRWRLVKQAVVSG